MHDLKEQLENNGFAYIPKEFSSKEISLLVKATDNILSDPNYKYDFLTIIKTKHIHKIRYMFEKSPIFVQSLVHNPILSIVTKLISPKTEIVPTWEDMLIKISFKGIPVTVHQDLALQSVGSDVFSLGIYLHDSGANPVHYLPASHKLGPLTGDQIYKVYDQEKNNFKPILAKAGDIIVHNVNTVHFSEENTSPYCRYTWYLEFRTKQQLQEDSPWNEEWIKQRRAIWVTTLKTYQKNIEYLIQDQEEISTHMEPLNLRISHTNDTVDYDMESPYNHFAYE